MSNTPSHSPTLAISSRLSVLTVVLSVALAGCYPSAPGPVGTLQFERESSETTLVKPAPGNSLSENKASDTSFSTSFSANTETTVAATLPSVPENSATSPRENEDEQYECTEIDFLGNLSVEIDGPAVAFADEDLSGRIKVVLYNDERSAQDKVEVSLHLSEDSKLDDGDLILTQPEHILTGPDAFSLAQIDLGKLQPLVGIPSGKYHVIVRIDEHSADSDCILDDNIASFPLEIL